MCMICIQAEGELRNSLDISREDAQGILWNSTAYPFNDGPDLLRQVRRYITWVKRGANEGDQLNPRLEQEAGEAEMHAMRETSP